jgi:hypothetical protein
MEHQYALSNEDLPDRLEWSRPLQHKSVLTFRAFKDAASPIPAPLLMFGTISRHDCWLSINGRRYPGSQQTLLGRMASFLLEAPDTHLTQWDAQMQALNMLVNRISFPPFIEPFVEPFVSSEGGVRFRWPLYCPRVRPSSLKPSLSLTQCSHIRCRGTRQV